MNWGPRDGGGPYSIMHVKLGVLELKKFAVRKGSRYTSSKCQVVLDMFKSHWHFSPVVELDEMLI